jgi:hypothetical protein
MGPVLKSITNLDDLFANPLQHIGSRALMARMRAKAPRGLGERRQHSGDAGTLQCDP